MKNMKYPALILTCIFCLCVAPLPVYGLNDLFSIPAGAPATTEPASYSLSITRGDVLELSANRLERNLALAPGSLRGITVTALPHSRDGELVLGGVGVERFQYIGRDELDALCLVLAETADRARVTLLPQGAESVPALLTVSALDEPNEPPVVEGASHTTGTGCQVQGFLPATDPEGDAVQLQLTALPEKGVVTLSGQCYTYEPFPEETGGDRFSLCAIDAYGNCSQEAVVEIEIEGKQSEIHFVDLTGSSSAYAAVKLWENGIASGEQIGVHAFFYPQQALTRGEFLVWLLAASGVDRELDATVNTGLPEDASLPLWLKPYVKAAVEEGIWSGEQSFPHEERITRAEAVALTARAAGIDDVKDFDLRMLDADQIPAWAVPYYKDLSAYRMLDLHDGYARPADTLDRACAADLAWQLYKHTHR